MRMKTLSLILGAAMLATSLPATAQTQPTATAAKSAEEASIPFADAGSIRDFRATNSETLYLQDLRRQWYRAELLSPCTDLPFAEAIGYDVRGSGRFDRFSTLVVRGRSCAIKSLVKSGPPPKREKRPR